MTFGTNSIRLVIKRGERTECLAECYPKMFTSIDLDSGRARFPTVFEVFGSDALRRQIEVFNSIVERRPRDDEDGVIVFGAMYDEGIRHPAPHRPILNSLSVLCERETNWPTGTGWLVRLEWLLNDVVRTGVSPGVFRDMLRSSQSFYDLIAELEWGTALRNVGGAFDPHTSTVRGEAGNFDIHWTVDPYGVLGDVKFYQNWLLRQRGEDPLTSKILLLRPDLRHNLLVTSESRELGNWSAVDAAVEVLAMYQAAEGTMQDHSFHMEREGRELVVFNREPNRYVDTVRFSPDDATEPGRGSILLVESEVGDDEDRMAARTNILKAVSQIPPPQANEVSCVFLGSSSPTDADTVADLALGPWRWDYGIGGPVRQGRGVLDPLAPEPDFRELQAIVHFAFWLEADEREPHVAHLYKVCQLFEKAGVLDDGKRDLLNRGMEGFCRPAVINTRAWSGMADWERAALHTAVEKRAYEIWVAEKRLHGYDLEHWFRTKAKLGIADDIYI